MQLAQLRTPEIKSTAIDFRTITAVTNNLVQGIVKKHEDNKKLYNDIKLKTSIMKNVIGNGTPEANKVYTELHDEINKDIEAIDNYSKSFGGIGGFGKGKMEGMLVDFSAKLNSNSKYQALLQAQQHTQNVNQYFSGEKRTSKDADGNTTTVDALDIANYNDKAINNARAASQGQFAEVNGRTVFQGNIVKLAERPDILKEAKEALGEIQHFEEVWATIDFTKNPNPQVGDIKSILKEGTTANRTEQYKNATAQVTNFLQQHKGWQKYVNDNYMWSNKQEIDEFKGAIQNQQLIKEGKVDQVDNTKPNNIYDTELTKDITRNLISNAESVKEEYVKLEDAVKITNGKKEKQITADKKALADFKSLNKIDSITDFDALTDDKMTEVDLNFRKLLLSNKNGIPLADIKDEDVIFNTHKGLSIDNEERPVIGAFVQSNIDNVGNKLSWKTSEYTKDELEASKVYKDAQVTIGTSRITPSVIGATLTDDVNKANLTKQTSNNEILGIISTSSILKGRTLDLTPQQQIEKINKEYIAGNLKGLKDANGNDVLTPKLKAALDLYNKSQMEANNFNEALGDLSNEAFNYVAKSNNKPIDVKPFFSHVGSLGASPVYSFLHGESERAFKNIKNANEALEFVKNNALGNNDAKKKYLKMGISEDEYNATVNSFISNYRLAAIKYAENEGFISNNYVTSGLDMDDDESKFQIANAVENALSGQFNGTIYANSKGLDVDKGTTMNSNSLKSFLPTNQDGQVNWNAIKTTVEFNNDRGLYLNLSTDKGSIVLRADETIDNSLRNYIYKRSYVGAFTDVKYKDGGTQRDNFLSWVDEQSLNDADATYDGTTINYSTAENKIANKIRHGKPAEIEMYNNVFNFNPIPGTNKIQLEMKTLNGTFEPIMEEVNGVLMPVKIESINSARKYLHNVFNGKLFNEVNGNFKTVLTERNNVIKTYTKNK